MKDLNDRAGYATLTVQFNVPILAVEVAQKGWDPASVVDEASASMVSVLQGLATAGIWFAIVWLPILLIVGLVVVIVSRDRASSRVRPSHAGWVATRADRRRGLGAHALWFGATRRVAVAPCPR